MNIEIIPVIDLKAGKAVHAKGGRRDKYQPVQSRLCPDGDALTLIRNFLDQYHFSRLYIADLDAITASGNHDSLLRSIEQQYPELETWIDTGIKNQDSLQQFHQKFTGRPVMGSETLTGTEVFSMTESHAKQAVLSLDFSHKGFLGLSELHTNNSYWPDDVIVMSLDHVGSDCGPDFTRLDQLSSLSSKSRLYAAGGIRNNQDLLQLADAGIHGALVASALHNDQLNLSH